MQPTEIVIVTNKYSELYMHFLRSQQRKMHIHIEEYFYPKIIEML